MKKLLLTLFIVSASIATCLAQKDQTFDMGLSGGVPVGQYTNTYTYAIGFFVNYEVPAKVKNLEYLFAGTYYHYAPKTVPYNPKVPGPAEADFVSLDVGLKYFIGKFYIAGEVGASPNVTSAYHGSFLGLDVQPAIGYTQRVFDTDELDFGFAYDSRINSGSSISQVMAHVAYRFDL